ncbi:MAG TPA: hypothetical protein VGS28_05060 [Candidatus Saccharimonadales bacterium]|nr:hypothetical protein [Candidatus Saccharimonadales bacterium]
MNTRSIVGKIIGAVGAVIVVIGIFFKWAQGVTGLKTPIARLASAQPQPSPHQISHSMGLVFAAWALLLLICSVFGRRMLAFFFAFCTLATVLLWAGMMYLYISPRSFGVHNIQIGAWIVVAGAVLTLIGSRIIPKRRKE